VYRALTEHSKPNIQQG